MGQKGFVLYLAVMLLALIGLYVLTLSEILFVYSKNLNVLASQHQEFYALEKAMTTLLHRSPNDCLFVVVPGQNIHAFKTIKKCIYTEGEYQFDYIWLDLGGYPNVCVDTQYGKRASHHYSLSVWPHQHLARGVQQYVIKPDMVSTCTHPSSYVAKGVSSWRELTQFID